MIFLLGYILGSIYVLFKKIIFLKNCSQSFKPVFYKRYVDSTFVLFNDPYNAQLLVNYINSFQQSIKFTIEFEKADMNSFLDIKVHRLNPKLSILHL